MASFMGSSRGGAGGGPFQPQRPPPSTGPTTNRPLGGQVGQSGQVMPVGQLGQAAQGQGMRPQQVGQHQSMTPQQQNGKPGPQQSSQGQYRMPVGISQLPANSGSRTQPSMTTALGVQNQHNQPAQQIPAQTSAAVRSVDDFVKSLDAELESLRKTGEQQRNRQQQVPRTAPVQTPSDYRSTLGATSTNSRAEETTGLGLHVWEGSDGYMVVRSVLPNGASGRSGLIHEGDTILSLDGIDMRGKSLQEFQKLALGPAGTIVRVRTRSRAGTLNVVSITRLSTLSTSQSASSGTVSVPNSLAATGNSHSEQPNPHIPAALSGKSSSGRTFPAKATMQWDYIATREDELTAMAGESILVAGEYKNPGWVWAARLLGGGQSSTYRLVPANYITYSDGLLSKSSNGMETSIDKRASPLLTSNSSASTLAPSTSMTSSSRASPLLPAASTTQVIAVASSVPVAAATGTVDTARTPVVPEAPVHQQVSLFSEADAPKDVSKAGMPVAVAASGTEAVEEDEGFVGSGMQLIGDANDPYLDGMYEDERGLISVNC